MTKKKNDKVTKIMLGAIIVLLVILIIGVYMLLMQGAPDSNGNVVVTLG